MVSGAAVSKSQRFQDVYAHEKFMRSIPHTYNEFFDQDNQVAQGFFGYNQNFENPLIETSPVSPKSPNFGNTPTSLRDRHKQGACFTKSDQLFSIYGGHTAKVSKDIHQKSSIFAQN